VRPTTIGLNDTGFSLTAKQRARQASLHARDTNGKLLPQPLRKLDVPKVLSGGGGIYSTAPDYLTLLQALLNGGGLRETGILRPETVALMSENQIATSKWESSRRQTRRYRTMCIFSGRSAAMGIWTHDQYRSRPRLPQGRQPHMGRSVQYILLDRPDDADRRRDHDADPPLCRPTSS